MLEIPRQDVSCKQGRIPHHEANTGGAPGYDRIQRGIVDEFESLGQERRNRVPLQAFKWAEARQTIKLVKISA